MGELLVFFLIVYGLYVDAKTLFAEDEALYLKFLRVKPWIWTILVLFLFVILCPVYLIARRKFLLQFKSKNETSGALPKNQNFSSITEFNGIILTWCLIGCYLILGMQIFMENPGFRYYKVALIVLIGIFSDLLMIALIYNTSKKNKQGSFLSQVSFKKVDHFFLKALFFPIVLGSGLAGIAFIIVRYMPVVVPSPLHKMLSHGPPSSLLLYSGAGMLFSPILEEIFFRGYLYTFIDRIKGRLFAIFFVSFIFGMVHVDQLWGDWVKVVTIFLMGLIVTFMRARSGSVIPSIVTHYSYNMSLLIIPVVYVFIVNPSYGKLAVMRGKLDVAAQERLLKESIKQHPDFDIAYNNLAWLYSHQNKKLDEALKLIDTALQYKPQKAVYLDTKAEILFKMGRLNEAIDIEKKIVQKYPESEYYRTQLEKLKHGSLEEKAPLPLTDQHR